MSSSIFHIIPNSVFSKQYHGSYKDVISRIRFFEHLGIAYHQVQLDRDSSIDVLNSYETGSDPIFFIEYCAFPKMLRGLRKKFPFAIIAIRAHNIEPLQHLDNNGWWPSRGPFWVLYGMLRLFVADLVMKHQATRIYSISEWENSFYWNWLPGKARVEWLPYFCPEHLTPLSSHEQSKKRRIVCLPTSQKNRKSWDLVTRFISFSENMKEKTGNYYDFLITGDLSDWRLPSSDAVTYTGMIRDLRGFLGSVNAVAMLSGMGHGYKTTISDAIAGGAVVIAHPRLAAKCPDILQPAILPFDSERVEELDKVITFLSHGTNHAKAERQLRDRSINLLNQFALAQFRPNAI